MLSSFLSLSFSCHPNHLIITINSEFISNCHSPYSFSPSSSPFPFKPTSFPSHMLYQSIPFIFTIFHSASLNLNRNNNNFFISSIIYSYSIIYPYVPSPHRNSASTVTISRRATRVTSVPYNTVTMPFIQLDNSSPFSI